MLKKIYVKAFSILLLLGLLILAACADTPAAIMPPDYDTEVTPPPGYDSNVPGYGSDVYEDNTAEDGADNWQQPEEPAVPEEPTVAPYGPITELPAIWDIPQPPGPANMAEDLTTTTLLQLTPLTPGELLVTMHTSLGDITMRFFPTEAPLAVENFLTHAWDGYYDGIFFHRVIPNFMIQGGCPLGTGTGGQSIWGGQFGQELSTELRHFRGALAMAQSAMPNSIGSQFYVVQNSNLDPGFRSEFVGMLEMQDESAGVLEDGSSVTYGDVFPAESLRHFLENGGTPHLDWHFSENPHTVFGHVVAGMDVVDEIANVPQNAQNRPLEDVLIVGFTFHYYEGEAGQPWSTR